MYTCVILFLVTLILVIVTSVCHMSHETFYRLGSHIFVTGITALITSHHYALH